MVWFLGLGASVLLLGLLSHTNAKPLVRQSDLLTGGNVTAKYVRLTSLAAYFFPFQPLQDGSIQVIDLPSGQAPPSC